MKTVGIIYVQTQYNQHETVCSPLQDHEHATVYCQINLQFVLFFYSKKNCFFIDSHFGRDNVNIDYVKRSSNSVYHIIALNKLS